MPGPAPGGGPSAGAPLLAPDGVAKARPSPARSPLAFAITVRGPLLVHTSMPCTGAGANAPVTKGATVANAISTSASQAQARLRKRLKRGIAGIGKSRYKSQGQKSTPLAAPALGLAAAQGLAGASCMPCWCTPVSPLGALVATGTFRSSVLSTPRASLNRSVTGIVVSFCKGSFSSISIR